MDDGKLLSQIGELIDKKLKPIKEQLDTVEMKIELVNKRVEKAQVDTMDALSELVTNGHELHEDRIKKIEDQLKSSHVQ